MGEQATRLAKTRQQATETLRGRVEVGEELLERYVTIRTSRGQDIQLPNDGVTWHLVNKQVLNQTFTTDEYLKQYQRKITPVAVPVVAPYHTNITGFSGRSRALDPSFQSYERTPPPAYRTPAPITTEGFIRIANDYLRSLIEVVSHMDEAQASPPLSTTDTYIAAREKLQNITRAPIMEAEGSAVPLYPPHFPAQVTNNFHAPVSNAAFQQGNQNSTQNVNITSQCVPQLEDWLRTLEDALPTLGLSADAQRGIVKNIDVVKGELEEPEPDSTIIQKGMERVKGFMTAVAEHAVAAKLLEQLPTIMVAAEHLAHTHP